MLIFGLHRWRGETGKKYWFNITLTDKGLPSDPGIYIFVRRYFVFWLKPLYVGKAASLSGRLKGHEKWGRAWWQLGATERHVARFKSEAERRRVEEDLIRGLKPVMNDVHIPRHAFDAPNDKKLLKKWNMRHFWFKRKKPHAF
ncbi:GIY-YIG nuclease family protein [Hirschia litorea]|uniref:GIY-YIG nuclease family protein n=1 Tax=Hirschia litorea TaxID=1199156 RepID=A0ABW2IGN9_9PROT